MMNNDGKNTERTDGHVRKSPQKKKKPNTNAMIRLGLLIFFIAMFVFSIGMLIYQQHQYKKSELDMEDAASVAGIPDMDDLIDVEPDDDWFDEMYGDYFTESTTAVKEPETAPPETTPGDSSPADSAPDESTAPAETEPPVTEAPPVDNTPKVDPYEEKLKNADLDSLRAVNSDVIGWIYITGTDISYPLMHAEDNDKYLRSSWKDPNKYSTAGTIFMEALSSPDLTDFNTIIYGHRMRNETMFGKLKYYNKKSYWKKHPSVYIRTDEGVIRYDIYAAYEISTSGETYRISFPDDASKQAYIDFTLESSVLSTGIIPNVNDQILTLSTCSGNGYETRWIVQAIRARK